MCAPVSHTDALCLLLQAGLFAGGGVVVHSVYPEQLKCVQLQFFQTQEVVCVCVCKIIYETYDQYINIYIVHDAKTLVIFLNLA